MDRGDLLFVRNFFFRAFMIGIALTVFYFIATYIFWGAAHFGTLRSSFRTKTLFS
jgi:hypothetical protein